MPYIPGPYFAAAILYALIGFSIACVQLAELARKHIHQGPLGFFVSWFLWPTVVLIYFIVQALDKIHPGWSEE